MKQSISELNLLTGIDRRRIARCLQDLAPETGPKGSLLYESTLALPLLFLQPGAGDSFDLTAERARLAHFQANAAELTAAQLKGSLIPIEEVADVVGDEFTAVRAKLLSIPSKCAPQAVGLCTTAVRALLDAAIREALEELTADDPRRHSL